MSKIRIQRMESELIKLFNTALSFEIRDDNLSWVSISTIKLSPDFKYARIYFTCLSHNANIEKILKAFKRTNGFFRGKIASAKMMRVVPELKFFYDDTEKVASELDDLFKKINLENN